MTGEVLVAEYLGADLHHWGRLPSGERLLVAEKNVGQPLQQGGTAVRIRFEPGGCIVLPASPAERYGLVEGPERKGRP